MGLGELLADREPEPEARRLRRDERLEEGLTQRGVEPRALVDDLHPGPRAVRPGADRDAPARRRGLHRVSQQVLEERHQLVDVPRHRRDVGGHLEDQLQALLLRHRRQHRHDVGQHRVEGDWMRRPRRVRGEGAEPLGELDDPGDLGGNDAHDEVPVVGIVEALGHERDQVRDRRQRRTDLVGQARVDAGEPREVGEPFRLALEQELLGVERGGLDGHRRHLGEVLEEVERRRQVRLSAPPRPEEDHPEALARAPEPDPHLDPGQAQDLLDLAAPVVMVGRLAEQPHGRHRARHRPRQRRHGLEAPSVAGQARERDRHAPSVGGLGQNHHRLRYQRRLEDPPELGRDAVDREETEEAPRRFLQGAVEVRPAPEEVGVDQPGQARRHRRRQTEGCHREQDEGPDRQGDPACGDGERQQEETPHRGPRERDRCGEGHTPVDDHPEVEQAVADDRVADQKDEREQEVGAEHAVARAPGEERDEQVRRDGAGRRDPEADGEIVELGALEAPGPAPLREEHAQADDRGCQEVGRERGVERA